MIVTYSRAGESVRLRIADERCDALLDYLAANFQRPNPEADQRWERMMAARGLSTPGGFAKTQPKRRA